MGEPLLREPEDSNLDAKFRGVRCFFHASGGVLIIGLVSIELLFCGFVQD